jgi:tRNA1(Val) A37 N6-methylase TrmN6
MTKLRGDSRTEESTSMRLPLSQKEAGAYYTPDPVVSSLISWAVRSEDDRLLDPSCGDGGFIAAHRNSVGIEQDLQATRIAMARAPWALVHEGDFFAWASETVERFECSAGNPPFIRYQNFKGGTRARAIELCARLGADFSGLASSWAPFLVATAGLLKLGGRMAFVVPAEIGHAPYAAPLLEHLIKRFSIVHIVAVREKLFPDLSQDCWLLYADGFGGRADGGRVFSAGHPLGPLRHSLQSHQPRRDRRSSWRPSDRHRAAQPAARRPPYLCDDDFIFTCKESSHKALYDFIGQP